MINGSGVWVEKRTSVLTGLAGVGVEGIWTVRGVHEVSDPPSRTKRSNNEKMGMFVLTMVVDLYWKL